jgi:hypothetical protein
MAPNVKMLLLQLILIHIRYYKILRGFLLSLNVQLKQITNWMQQFFQFIILMFIYNLTYFGRSHAHQQELNNCSSSLWFYLRDVVIAVLLVVFGPAGRTDHDQQHCYHHALKVKPEAATAVVEFLMMGVKTPETC